jgi:hypothetical protein
VYCLERLGLSEGSVSLRIHVANVARRFPQVLAAIAEGRIRLSVAGRLAPHLNEENVEDLPSVPREATFELRESARAAFHGPRSFLL